MLGRESEEQIRAAAGRFDQNAPAVRRVTAAADEPYALAAIDEPDSALMPDLQLFG